MSVNKKAGTTNDDVIHGTPGDDAIQGNAGNDTVFGEDGRDQLEGNSGNDVLIGGAGCDILTGGAGRDTFTYLLPTDQGDLATGIETITDFSHNFDTIDLSALHPVSVTWFEGGAVKAANTFVEADLDGDGNSDFTIMLSGINLHLTADDFIL